MMETEAKYIFTQESKKSYKFAPTPDITPLEAAWIAYFFATHIVNWGLEEFEQWPLIERHFEEVTR